MTEIDFDQIKAQFDGWLAQVEAQTAASYAAYLQELQDYLEAYQSVINADETAAAGDYANFKATIEDYIEQLAEIIDAGDVGPIVLRLTQLEEDFLSFPWRRPEGLLTDQSGNEIEDENGDPINITTLSLAEVAAGVINGKLHH